MSRKRAQEIPFSCTCGSLQGHITKRGMSSGTHVVCFCRDCRAAQLYFGQPDPAPGPVEILHMTPEDIVIDQGAEHLAAMRLSPRGMLRWYADCCNAPLVTTPASPKLPFGGFIVKRLADPAPLGPVTTRGFVPTPGGKQKHQKLRYAVIGLLKRIVASRLSGRWKTSIFFDAETGQPTVTPTVLSKSERAALYP
ncbi:DUF6151 family protein [Ruegeria sp.]|uniref:DUF6151 family protein n=1 Tax=Ruegeria sp. TaxID=1879320 RepID=UPI00230E781C|nr:DUF6151 family protein [Ruegeria sp.]MDA7964264.1 DUF6151 family protein [Ruegeria sp.]